MESVELVLTKDLREIINETLIKRQCSLSEFVTRAVENEVQDLIARRDHYLRNREKFREKYQLKRAKELEDRKKAWKI